MHFTRSRRLHVELLLQASGVGIRVNRNTCGSLQKCRPPMNYAFEPGLHYMQLQGSLIPRMLAVIRLFRGFDHSSCGMIVVWATPPPALSS